MSLGESASQTGSDHGSHSASDVEGDYNDPLEPLEPLEAMRPRDGLDPTQVVPSSLYSIDMFSSQDSGSQGESPTALPGSSPFVGVRRVLNDLPPLSRRDRHHDPGAGGRGHGDW